MLSDKRSSSTGYFLRQSLKSSSIWSHGSLGLSFSTLPCRGIPLGTSDQKRHFEKRLIKEKRGANVELGREGLLDEGCCVGALSPTGCATRDRFQAKWLKT